MAKRTPKNTVSTAQAPESFMTFSQARAKLTELAKGEYFTIRYEEGQHHGSPTTQKCELYVHGWNTFYCGSTWEEAFSAMDKARNPKYTEGIGPDADDAPL
jgi:hypothetical protein